MKNLKNEKGAITLITLITILFMISFLMTSYVLIANKVKTQKEILNETKKIYEPKATMEEIYNSYFTNDNIIPIYTVEQLLAMGNDKTININGKVYIFSNTEDTAYLLKNDLEFSAEDFNLESDWIPPYKNEELLVNFDWSGHTIKVTKLNGDIITYDGTYLATVTGNSLTLKNSVKGKLLDYKIYGNSVQNGTPSPSAPVEIQSVGDKTNNLIEYPYMETTKTTNGITFTDNGDGTITVNGTATANAMFNIISNATKVWEGIQAGETYTLSLETDSNYNGSTSGITYALNYYPLGASGASYNGWMGVAVGASITAKCPADIAGIRSYIYISSGKTFNNIVLKPKLEKGTEATGYEPYNKYKIPIKVSNGTNETTTDIYLDEPLRKAGSYVDYIDFEAGNVVREVKERQVTSTTSFATYTYASSNFYGFAFTDSNMIKGTRWDGFCSHLPNKTKVWFSVGNNRIYISLNDIYNSATTDNERKVKLKEWLDGLETPFIVQFPATLPTEPIELPDISILKGTNKIEIDTQVQPSSISVTYNAKQ